MLEIKSEPFLRLPFAKEASGKADHKPISHLSEQFQTRVSLKRAGFFPQANLQMTRESKSGKALNLLSSDYY